MSNIIDFKDIIDIKDINNKSNELIEKIICQDCGYITFRKVEKQVLPNDANASHIQPLYAILIKKSICPHCNSTNNDNIIIKQNEINIEEIENNNLCCYHHATEN